MYNLVGEGDDIMLKNTIISIAVCDDLAIDRSDIVSLIQKYADEKKYVILIDEFQNGKELLENDISKYNLIILDILMENLNGIEVAKEIIARSNNIPVIFCSISNDFAEESYDVKAYRYLTKPIDKNKFYLILDDFFKTKTNLKMISYKRNRMEEKVYVSDILWIEAAAHRSIIHLKYGDIITNTILKEFCAALSEEYFIKPIRFALVSLDAIDGIPDTYIKLIDGTVIAISRDSRKMVRQTYINYKMKNLSQKGDSL